MSRLPKPRLVAAVLAAALLSVLLAPTATSADEVHLELATTEQLPVPNGYMASPSAVNADGSVVGVTLPPGLAMSWPSGPGAGFVGAPAGAATADLVDIDDEGVGLGTVRYGVLGNTEPAQASLLDTKTGVWTDLPTPDGWRSAGWRMSEDGTIVGEGAPDGEASRPVAWLSPAGPMVESPVVGLMLRVTPTGRVLMDLPDHVGAVWWSPHDGSVEAIPLPYTDVQILDGNDLGQYIFGFFETSDGVVWDSTTGTMTPCDIHDVARLNDAGQALVTIDGRPSVVDAATGSQSPVTPFGLGVPASEMVVVDFDIHGRVLGRLSTPGAQRVFVWSSTEHTVDLGPATGPDALAPMLLSPGGVAVGTASNNNVLWRATFRLAPNAPEDLAGTAEGATVALSWEPPGSQGDAPIDAYVVKADGTEVGRVAAGDTTWSGTAGGEAAYTVVAVNAYGESAPSDAVVLAASGSVTPAFTG